jgi:Tfp pilus assembly protein PilF
MVVPRGFKITNTSKDYTLKTSAENHDIYLWSQETPVPQSNHVDLIIKPKSKITTPQDKLESENLSSKGWQLWRERKLFEAEEVFSEAVELDPANENAWQGLGWAQLNQGKKLNAKHSFEKCVELNPSNSAALNGLGWIARGQGSDGQAVQWWLKAVKASKGTATASLAGLTEVYMERKEYDNALKYYKIWLKAEPENEQAKQGLKNVTNML